jgi:hypothetical protein
MSEQAGDAPDGVQGQLVEAPEFIGSLFHLNIISNEVALLVSRAAFVVGGDGTAPALPSFILRLSPQSLKDLSLLLSRNVERYEADWGPIETDFTRRK